LTLILALLSKEGIVLASDGQSTELTSGQLLKGKTDKIFTIGSALWGASGDVGAIQEITTELAKLGASAQGQYAQLRSAFVEDVHKVNQPRLARYMSMHGAPIPGIQTPPTARVLFAQYEAEQPHIVEITENGSATNPSCLPMP
jgi:20S proteasome alpha/beta subunit